MAMHKRRTTMGPTANRYKAARRLLLRRPVPALETHRRGSTLTGWSVWHANAGAGAPRGAGKRAGRRVWQGRGGGGDCSRRAPSKTLDRAL